MIFKNISKLRLINQQIIKSKFNSAKDIVSWMGAMQAQDYNMAKWAIGIRLPGSTENLINLAINKGEIIRTHLLRPTWHFVSADDIYWMLELTAPRIKSSLKARHKELELDKKVFTKTKKILRKILNDGNHLTRKEINLEFERNEIKTNNNRLSHILLTAELDGLICSGSIKENQTTYTLLNERVPRKNTFKKDEALGNLAQKYFSSHGPATLIDFVWWSGLSVTDAKNALELIKPDLISEKIDGKIYWFFGPSFNPKLNKKTIHFLPAYDEFIISYKDRSAALTAVNHKMAVSNNGIFRPVIIKNGIVVGLWKRTIKKDKIILEIKSFSKENLLEQSLIPSAKNYGKFFGKNVEIKIAKY